MDFVNDQHRFVVDALNDAVIASGAPMEGNLYYMHHQILAHDRSITPLFDHKREQLVIIAGIKRNVLEIGVNAGHSAALMLSANPDLHYVGIDICYHAYTRPCVEILKRSFPGRVRFFPGDSTVVYPSEHRHFEDCDLVHIDGGHTMDLLRADLRNALTLPYRNEDRHLLIDDTNDPWNPEVSPELQRWIDDGWIAVDDLGGQLRADGNHLLVKPLRRS